MNLREEEPQNTNTHKTPGRQPSLYLSLSNQDDCKTRKDAKYCIAKQNAKYWITKQGLRTEPQQTMEATINNESTTPEPPP